MEGKLHYGTGLWWCEISCELVQLKAGLEGVFIQGLRARELVM